jgi:hypothetical protein
VSFTNQTKKNTYTGDGVTASFAFSFPILEEDDLLVQIKDTNGTVTNKTITTEYTVNGTGNRTGFTDYTTGNVVFTAGNIPLSTDTIIIKRNIPFTQETDYTENGRFPAESHERALDKLTFLQLQQQESIDQSPKFDSDISFSGNLPDPSADKYIKFDAAGTGFEAVTLSSTSGLGNIVEDVSPQLGGDLDLNSNDITGTGNVKTSGYISVLGTVNGRDVATDGSKLDGIEASADVTDETNVKAALDGATISSVTAATGDKVLIQDISDSDNLKHVTVSSLLKAIPDQEAISVSVTSQVVTTGVTTTIQYNTEAFDTRSSFANYRWTPKVAGLYYVNAWSEVAIATDQTRFLMYIRKNGIAIINSDRTTSGTSAADTIQATGFIEMNGTTDYITVSLLHTKGSNATINKSEIYGIYLGDV